MTWWLPGFQLCGFWSLPVWLSTNTEIPCHYRSGLSWAFNYGIWYEHRVKSCMRSCKNSKKPNVSNSKWEKNLFINTCFKFLPCLWSTSPHHWKHDSVLVELSKYENWRYLAERITLQTWKLKISFLKFKLYQHFLLSHFVLTSELTPL